jgi:AraC-like DNA-binding protein
VRHFQRDLKLSPQVYVEKQRLSRACHLLNRTTLSVKEIAEELAYSSQFYFARRFKRYQGMSPTSYRAGVWGTEVIVTT